jgi:hypothetical protein
MATTGTPTVAEPADAGAADRESLTARLREAADLLERIAADRRVLDQVPEQDRARLLHAIAEVYSPDRYARRRMTKQAHQARKAARATRDDGVRSSSAIRTLHRRRPANTPNVFAPLAFEPDDVTDVADADAPRESVDPQHCYVCKQKYTEIHHFYDQLCPACAALNYTKRTELADLSGRVALLTGGRGKFGYQTGL